MEDHLRDPGELFSPGAGVTYLDTATYGLPPQPTIDAMTDALAGWQAGTAYWIDDWDVAAERARQSFADLIAVPSSDVAIIPAASVGVGTVASGLSPDDRVVVPDDEFTSLLFPLLVAETHGTQVDQVPFAELAERIGSGTSLVAFSLVQMQTGRVAPLEAIVERAERVGARVLVDASHALPFVGMNGALARVDYLVTCAYKHLLCPRGVAFLVVRSEHHESLPPWNANWRSSDDPYGRYCGGPLSLGPGAVRFDVSVAWLPWLGAATSLELLNRWSQRGHLGAPKDKARELAATLDVEWGGSTLVVVPVGDVDAARATLESAGVKAGFRGDGLRLSTHVYTTDDDVDRAVEVIRPLLT